jgi:hypothetical protein
MRLSDEASQQIKECAALYRDLDTRFDSVQIGHQDDSFGLEFRINSSVTRPELKKYMAAATKPSSLDIHKEGEQTSVSYPITNPNLTDLLESYEEQRLAYGPLVHSLDSAISHAKGNEIEDLSEAELYSIEIGEIYTEKERDGRHSFYRIDFYVKSNVSSKELEEALRNIYTCIVRNPVSDDESGRLTDSSFFVDAIGAKEGKKFEKLLLQVYPPVDVGKGKVSFYFTNSYLFNEESSKQGDVKENTDYVRQTSTKNVVKLVSEFQQMIKEVIENN